MSSADALVEEIETVNVVMTFVTRLLIPKAMAVKACNDANINLSIVAVALAVGGKHSKAVFPASVSKSIIPIADVVPPEPSEAEMYPLHVKIPKKKNTKKRKAEAADTSEPLLTESDQLLKKIRQRQKRAGTKIVHCLTATVSHFGTYKHVVTGGKGVVEMFLHIIYYCMRVQQQLLETLYPTNISTVNIVWVYEFKFPLNIHWLAVQGEENGWKVNWNNEKFDGLSWLTEEDNLTFMFVCFASGNVIITGGKEDEHRYIARQRCQKLVAPFRRGNEPADYDPRKTYTRSADVQNEIKKFIDQHADVVGAVVKQKPNASTRNARKVRSSHVEHMRRVLCLPDNDSDSEEETDSDDENDESMRD